VKNKNKLLGAHNQKEYIKKGGEIFCTIAAIGIFFKKGG